MVAPAPASYERSPLRDSSLDDLDRAALEAFVRQRAGRLLGDEGRTWEQAAQRLGYLAAIGSSVCATVAGVLAFGRYPQIIRPEWGIAAVRVEGHSLSDPIAAREDVEGPLGELLEGALAFVDAHTHALEDAVAPGSRAIEYPRQAVREVLANALVHRDLRIPGRVSLRIFDDRMEVWSPGGVPGQLALDELAQAGGVSLPRNPLLASTARSLGLIDQIGRGLVTIRTAMSDATREPVRILVRQHDVMVVLPSALQLKPATN